MTSFITRGKNLSQCLYILHVDSFRYGYLINNTAVLIFIFKSEGNWAEEYYYCCVVVLLQCVVRLSIQDRSIYQLLIICTLSESYWNQHCNVMSKCFRLMWKFFVWIKLWIALFRIPNVFAITGSLWKFPWIKELLLNFNSICSSDYFAGKVWLFTLSTVNSRYSPAPRNELLLQTVFYVQSSYYYTYYTIHCSNSLTSTPC